jgi:hypothetical protein
MNGEACLIGSVGCVTDTTVDSHFNITNSKGVVEHDAPGFTFIGTNNYIFRARSSCGYSHNNNIITCNLTWEDVPHTYVNETRHEMDLFDGNGNCTRLSFNDVPGKQGTPVVTQGPISGCPKSKVTPHPAS